MNKKQQELLEREFKVNDKFTICRSDYENMPCSMFAWQWSDAQMEELAKNIARELSEYDYDVCDLDEEEMNDIFWAEMENCAVRMGMEYYEDMTDDEFNKHEEEWNKI